jgi:hypothetical protein
MGLIGYGLLKIRYSELLAKSERQRKRIALLERSRADMRKLIRSLRAQSGNLPPTTIQFVAKA